MREVLKTSCRIFAVLLGSAALGASAYASPGPPPTVPEIDPGAVVGALTLLVGGVLTLVDRRRSH